jgi:V/A-type H+-transporting ATPase subunit D
MRARGPAPTRYNLIRSKRRLGRVERGTDLLRRKRQALVGELFRLARAAVDARAGVEKGAEAFYPALLRALAGPGGDGLEAAGWPPRDIEVEILTARTWGIGIAEIIDRSPILRSLPARGTAPALTGPAAAEAAGRLEVLIELLLDAASREMLIRRLGHALAHTSRQLNTLELRVAPELGEQIARTRRILEEREREEHARVKHLMRDRSTTRQRRPTPLAGLP